MKIDPRTRRSLGRCLQLLTASRSARLSQWAAASKHRLKRPLYEIKRFSRLLAHPQIDRDYLAEQRTTRFRSWITKDTPIACDFSAVEWLYANPSVVSMNQTVIQFVTPLASLLNGVGFWL